MGMAASQARYLALTARKTNTEWEGQQINQARTALANQSANLFNQLLGMEVPNAPKTSDYTKIQYSYSDGNNDSVFEDWHQINTVNPNYNYVVSHYYMADVFTGIQRLLTDPEVQLNNVMNKMEYDNVTTKLSKDENQNLNVTYKINDYDHNQSYDKITAAQIEGDDKLKSSLEAFEEYAGLLKADGSLSTDGIYGYKDDDSVWHFFVANDYYKIYEADATSKYVKDFKKELEIYETENGLTATDGELRFDGIYKTQDGEGNWSFINIDDYQQMFQAKVEASPELRTALYNYEDENNLLNKYKVLSYDNVYGYKDDTDTWHFNNTNGYNPVVYYEVDADEALRTALTAYETENDLLDADGNLRYNEIFAKKDENGNWTFTNTIGYSPVSEAQVNADEELKTALTTYETEQNIMIEKADLTYDNIYGTQDADGNWSFVQLNNYSKFVPEDIEAAGSEALKKAATEYEIANDLMVTEPELTFDGIYSYKKPDGSYGFINTNDYTTLNQEVVDADEYLKYALTVYETENGLLNPDGSLTYDGIYGYKDGAGVWQFINTNDTEIYMKVTPESVDYSKNESLREALTKYETEHKMLKPDGSLNFNGIFGYQDSDGEWHFDVDTVTEAVSYIKAKDFIDYSIAYGPSFVGNSELHELNQLIVDRNTGLDQVTDLAQILKDCPDSAVKNYVNFDDYGNLQYAGKGIYTFELFGQTYYTTKDDLMESYNHARNVNTIDDQAKLAYYSASYVPQKIKETNQALIEKDSDGRFKNVKFENDSAVYNLNVEEVLNEQAYNDAMNAYLNKKAQYEKTIADINAKTSIIQKEDRTLELRLKQLDTEQHALATEMDAVKKVIKDNIEKTFKTFSD